MGIQLTQMKTRQGKKHLDATIGANVLKHRKQRKISREELAAILEVNTSHIGLIERGERGTSLLVLFKLIEIFGISIEALLDETDTTESEDSRNAFAKKVFTLASQLNERELNALTFYIKGLLALRDKSS